MEPPAFGLWSLLPPFKDAPNLFSGPRDLDDLDDLRV